MQQVPQGFTKPVRRECAVCAASFVRRLLGTDLGKCDASIRGHLFTTTRANTLRIACRRALGNCTEMTFSDLFWAIGTQNRRSEYAH